jgi:mannose-1-phosphate guanylyltransferase
MDSKALLKAVKIAVREVIKEELSEILREGLQSTITEMKQPAAVTERVQRNTAPAVKKSKVQFVDNKWASVLNETDALIEQTPGAMNSFAEMMNESMQDIHMTSADAKGFGAMRQNMKEAMGMAPAAPKIMEDPETGKTFEVPQEVQQAMTRDYSALMKAMNKKKGN